ncbi:hypothetical protein EXS54_00095 [Patescibacteria group bacterium]|nr:hypothetical protein [Patescibacteria group bacterium]
MAKKHKKRRKLSRRERKGLGHSGPEQRASTPIPVEAEPTSDAAPESTEPAATPEPAPAAAPVTATFTPTATRGDHGVDKEIEDVEYPAVRRDLRKLGVTIVVLILVIVGLTIWNDHSNVVGHLGSWLFSFWQ